MALDFVTIQTPEGHQSTLAISERHGRWIETIGVIPHCQMWRPATARDRDRLLQFFEELNYDHE